MNLSKARLEAESLYGRILIGSNFNTLVTLPREKVTTWKRLLYKVSESVVGSR